MPNGKRRTKRPLAPAKARAVRRVKKIIEKHEKDKKSYDQQYLTTRVYDPREAAEFKELFEASEKQIKKGENLIKKIKASKRAPRTTRKRGATTIRELIPRARPWTQRISKNRNYMSQLLPERRYAVEKLNVGKKVTRAEMNSIIDAVREYRGVILGETKFLKQTKHI